MKYEVRFLEPPGAPREAIIENERWIWGDDYDRTRQALEELREELAEKERTAKSHAHFFAELRDIYDSIPESMADAPYAKSIEKFRKHALIATGFCDTDVTNCENHEIALAVAPVMAKVARRNEGYAVVNVRGPLVVCSTAESQSYKAMGKDRFEESKARVLDWAHQLIGSQPPASAYERDAQR